MILLSTEIWTVQKSGQSKYLDSTDARTFGQVIPSVAKKRGYLCTGYESMLGVHSLGVKSHPQKVRGHTASPRYRCYCDSEMTNDAQGRARTTRDAVDRRWTGIAPLLAGLGAGAAGIVVSFGLKGGNLGRPLGDPVPLMLAATQVPNGFTYFPWRPALYHLIFAAILGLLAFAGLAVLGRGNAARQEAVRAGRIAALINVLFAAVFQVDAIVVGIWYLVSGLVSVLISGLVAGLAASYFAKRRKHDP
jgi:hypothetical protein